MAAAQLTPLVERLEKGGKDKIPKVEDYVPEFTKQDPRPAALEEFAKETSHFSDKKLVQDARSKLEEELGKAWRHAELANDAFGKQTLEVKTEEREHLKDKKKVHLKALFFDQVPVTKKVVRTETRTTTVYKNGTQESTEWTDTGSKTVVEEDAFSDLENVPKMEGLIRVKVVGDGFFAWVFGSSWRTQYVWLGDGHVIFWDSFTTHEGKTIPSGEASDTLSLLLNRAEVQVDDTDQFTFHVAPIQEEGVESATWADTSGFASGHGQGAFVFSSEGLTRSRAEWEEAFRKNINFAKQAFANLGDARIVKEVGTGIVVRKKAKDVQTNGEQPNVSGGSASDGLFGSVFTVAGSCCCGYRAADRAIADRRNRVAAAHMSATPTTSSVKPSTSTGAT